MSETPKSNGGGVLGAFRWFMRNFAPLFWLSVFSSLLGGAIFLAVYAPWILALLIAPTLIHFLYIRVTRTVGLYNPEHFHNWAFVPWRPVLLKLLEMSLTGKEGLYDLKDALYGKTTERLAKWVSVARLLTHLYTPRAYYFGRLLAYQIPFTMPVGANPTAHIVYFGMSGSRKTSSIATSLALHNGNSFVIDPQDYLTTLLHKRRGMGGAGIKGTGQDFHVIAPEGSQSGVPTSSWNFFDELVVIEKKFGRAFVQSFCLSASNLLIVQDSDNQPVFSNVARAYVQACLLFIHTYVPQEHRHLRLARDLIMGRDPRSPDGNIDTVCEMFVQCDEFNGQIREAGMDMRERDAKEKSTFLTSARNQTTWISSMLFDNLMTRSDFSLYDLKYGRLNLHISASSDLIRDDMPQFIRLMVGCALKIFERKGGTPNDDCLFIVDEFQNLGEIEQIAKAGPTLRRYGVKLVLAAQDIEGIRNAYPKAWATLIGNASYSFWFASRQPETLEYLQRLLDKSLGSTSYLQNFLNEGRSRMIVIGPRGAMRLRQAPYYNELPLYYYSPDPDPKHKENIVRRLVRRWLEGQITGPQAVPVSSALAQAPTPPPANNVRASTPIPAPPTRKQSTPTVARAHTLLKNPTAKMQDDVAAAMKLLGLRYGFTRADLDARMLSNDVQTRGLRDAAYRAETQRAHSLLIKHAR